MPYCRTACRTAKNDVSVRLSVRPSPKIDIPLCSSRCNADAYTSYTNGVLHFVNDKIEVSVSGTHAFFIRSNKCILEIKRLNIFYRIRWWERRIVSLWIRYSAFFWRIKCYWQSILPNWLSEHTFFLAFCHNDLDILRLWRDGRQIKKAVPREVCVLHAFYLVYRINKMNVWVLHYSMSDRYYMRFYFLDGIIGNRWFCVWEENRQWITTFTVNTFYKCAALRLDPHHHNNCQSMET